MMQRNEIGPDVGAGYGGRLKQAREAADLSLEEVSTRLKVPARVLRGLEAGDTAQLGAPIFVQGHARSYARLLGIDIEAELADVAQVEPVMPPELVSHSHTSRYRRMFEQLTHRAIYIVLTATLAIPVWMATRPHLDDAPAVQSLDLATPAATGSTSDDAMHANAGRSGSGLRSPGSANPRQLTERLPLMASMTSLQTPVADAPALSLRFSGKSWVEIFAPDGRSLEQGVLPAGEVRNYQQGEVGRIVLGNVAAVEMRQQGEPVDLAPFSRANVARIELSSDGSLAPAAD